jgi:hypothetical protein
MTEVRMKGSSQIKNPANWIESIIKDFINKSPENTLKNPQNDKAWADPLVGFSGGDDPLYQEYKKYVGPFHWTPLEAFKLTFPSLETTADQLTVISWILPQMESSKADLRRETVNPPESWARARIFGEETNVKLREHVVAALKEVGIVAFAPILSPLWARKESDQYVFASTWSERHAAYAAGLGTFGLCDGPNQGPTLEASLSISSCLLFVFFQRHLWEMHSTLPGRRHNQRWTRQKEMQRLSAADGKLCKVSFQFRWVWVWLLPDGCSLRVQDSR